MIKFFTRDDDLPEYLWLVKWQSGSVILINQWSQFPRMRGNNWINFTPIFADIEWSIYVSRVMITVMILGIGFRLTWRYASKEKQREQDRHFDTLMREWGTPEEDKACEGYMARMKELAAQYEGEVDTPYDPDDDTFDEAYLEAMELKKILP